MQEERRCRRRFAGHRHWHRRIVRDVWPWLYVILQHPHKFMATVYLHIGTMKTGTSALQRFLYENGEYLKEQGFLYPKLDLNLPGKYIFRNGHFVTYSVENNKELERDVDKQEVMRSAYEQLGGLAKEFDRIILSDELIWHYARKDPNFWTELAENFRKIGCELKIILYLRRQDAFIESLYSHTIKSNHKMEGSFSDFVKGNAVKYFVMDYYAGIKKMEQQLGKENLLIRIYEKERFVKNKNLIFSDFLETVGLSLDENYKLPQKAKNAGLEGNYIEIKRIMNELPEYQEIGNFMARPLVLASAVKAEGQIRRREGFFTPEGRKEFLAAFEEGNRKLAKEYLGREDGVLFREPEEELPAWRLDEENLWRDIIISMTEIFCAQDKRMAELEKEWKALKAEQEKNWIIKICRKLGKYLKK